VARITTLRLNLHLLVLREDGANVDVSNGVQIVQITLVGDANMVTKNVAREIVRDCLESFMEEFG
jgi:hypothetical protein